jgi:hypothetical protein
MDDLKRAVTNARIEALAADELPSQDQRDTTWLHVLARKPCD